jgi:hypothetical protein
MCLGDKTRKALGGKYAIRHCSGNSFPREPETGSAENTPIEENNI